jgi:hypothetical protein
VTPGARDETHGVVDRALLVVDVHDLLVAERRSPLPVSLVAFAAPWSS